MKYVLRAFPLAVFLFFSCIAILLSQNAPLFVSAHAATRFQQQQQQENVSVSTNEGRAIKALRDLMRAETAFHDATGKGEYADLKQLHDEGLIDGVLASGLKDGYRFSIALKKSNLTSAAAVDLIARPEEFGKADRRSFYLNESGVLLTSLAKNAPVTEMRPFANEIEATKDKPVKPDEAASVDVSDEAGPDDKVNANETAVIAALRAIHSAESNFKTKFGEYGALEQLAVENMLDKKRAVTTQSGYVLEIKTVTAKPDAPATFAVYANPQAYGVSGRSSFYIDHTGVLRGGDKEGSAADASDPAIEK